MTGQLDPAAAGRDWLRAGHADREQVIGTLKDAFVQGRLTRDVLDARAGRALSARTYADLAALTADIPAVPAMAATARPPAPVRRRPLARAAAGSGACLIIAAAAWRVGDIVDPGARPTPYDSWAARWRSWPFSPSSRRSASWGTGWPPHGSSGAPAGSCRPGRGQAATT